jgi:hypothetical protein
MNRVSRIFCIFKTRVFCQISQADVQEFHLRSESEPSASDPLGTGLQIWITLMRIRIHLFTKMQIRTRILIFTLTQIRISSK